MRLGLRIVEREAALGEAGDDARAVDAQALGLGDQAEFDRIPVKPRKMLQRAQLERALAAAAIGCEIIREDRVGEHRYMAEHVVEHVRFLQIVELVGPADEIARDEAAIGHVVEEHIVRHQAGHRHDLPAGQAHQPFGQFLEIGDAGLGQLEHVEPAQIGLRRATGEQFRLAVEQRVPHRMLVRGIMGPVLRDGPVGGRAFGRAVENMRFFGHEITLSHSRCRRKSIRSGTVQGWLERRLPG